MEDWELLNVGLLGVSSSQMGADGWLGVGHSQKGTDT